MYRRHWGRVCRAANGRKPTDNEVAILGRDTRAEKLIEISSAAKRAQQLDRLTPDEAQSLTSVRQSAVDVLAELRLSQSAGQSLTYAEDHIYERISVARDYELFTDAERDHPP